jgi:hypothetical protein
MIVPVVRSYRFVFDLDEEIRRRLWGGVGAGVEGKADVSEKIVSHHRRSDPNSGAGPPSCVWSVPYFFNVRT